MKPKHHPKIRWQLFPSNNVPSSFLLDLIQVFEANFSNINSFGNIGQKSNDALIKLLPDLQAIGYKVELNKTQDGKIRIPVLFSENGKIEKSFEADAFHALHKVVLEVEAGRAVANYQFLKDIFQACLMNEVDYCCIAVRQSYKESNDFEKVINFVQTIYASDRLKLPLKGILIIGY